MLIYFRNLNTFMCDMIYFFNCNCFDTQWQ